MPLILTSFCSYIALVNQAGCHARSYGVVVAASIVAVLLHPVIPHIAVWCGLRVINGMALGRLYRD